MRFQSHCLICLEFLALGRLSRGKSGNPEARLLCSRCLPCSGIAEMGEWIVFRERKDNAKPFFWNMSTEEKSWEAPAILQELGVAEVLQKLDPHLCNPSFLDLIGFAFLYSLAAAEYQQIEVPHPDKSGT